MKRSRQTLPLSDLSPEQRAAVETQLAAGPSLRALGEELDRVGSVITRGGYPAPEKAHGPAPKDGYRSKAERDYAAWLATFPACVWAYEHASFALPGKGTRYRPDFGIRWTGLAVYDVGGHAEGLPHGFDRYLVEVKGTKDGRPFWRSEAARLRALTAAAVLWDGPERRPLFVAWRVGGEWKHERVEVRA